MAKSESNKAVANLIQWMKREPIWTSRYDALMVLHTASTLNVNDLTYEELNDTLGEAHSQLFGCVFEHLCAAQFTEAPINFVDDYLKRRGWRDSIPSRRYMAALRDASLSLYEITAVQPGSWVEVKDLVRNTLSIRKREHSGSMNMVRWDKIAARVVDYQGEKLFTGVLIRYSAKQAEQQLSILETNINTTLAAQNLTRADADQAVVNAVIHDALLSSTAAYTINWLDEFFAARHQARPPLFNFEGDPIQFTETRFALEATANTRASVIAGLDKLNDVRRVNDAPPTWDWLSHNIKLKPVNNANSGNIIQTIDPDSGAQILGMMSLADDVLLLTTNSLTRMQNGIALLDGALAGLIKTKLTQLISIEEMLKRQPNAKNEDAATKVPPAIAAKIKREFFDKHYQDWIDTPLPGLNGRTPRETVKTKSGQDEVVALLKWMENLEARNKQNANAPRYDFGWLWEALGLQKHRQ